MLLEGHLNASGPDLLERLRKGESVRFYKNKAEFDLQVSDSEKETLDFDVWIPLSDSDEVTIETDVEDENLTLNGTFHIDIKDSKGGCVGITLSVDQVKTLKKLFEDYVSAYDAHRALLKNKFVRVKAI